MSPCSQLEPVATFRTPTPARGASSPDDTGPERQRPTSDARWPQPSDEVSQCHRRGQSRHRCRHRHRRCHNLLCQPPVTPPVCSCIFSFNACCMQTIRVLHSFLSSNETHASFDIRHQANTYDERDRFLTTFCVSEYLIARAVLFDRVATLRKGKWSRDNTRAETITGSATSPFPHCRYKISWQHAHASHLISRANISCYNFLQQLASD